MRAEYAQVFEVESGICLIVISSFMWYWWSQCSSKIFESRKDIWKCWSMVVSIKYLQDDEGLDIVKFVFKMKK